MGDKSFYLVGKPIIDSLLGLSLLVALSPLLAILVVLIRLTSKGPGIYRQMRLGRNGRIFTMYKLRTMHVDAEALTGPVWAAVGRDPRVTRLGHWLRRTHLDELPQLVNLLWGEMSLIGPRPERPVISAVLADAIPGYVDRLAARPGITGLAQINLPPDSDLDSVRAKLQLDMEYVRSASLWLDLRIALCTFLYMLGLRGGRTAGWLGLHRQVHLAPNHDEPARHKSLPVVVSMVEFRSTDSDEIVNSEDVIVASPS